MFDYCLKDNLSDDLIQTVLDRLKIKIDRLTLLDCVQDLEIIRCETIERRFDDWLLFMAFPEISIYQRNVVPVDIQARELELEIIVPNLENGQYVGPLAATDNQYGLVNFARNKAVKFLYWNMRDDQRRPRGGDTVRLKYRSGQLSVSIADRPNRHS